MSRQLKYLVFVFFVMLFLVGVGQVSAFNSSNISENISEENYIVESQENINENQNIKDSLKIGEKEFFLVENRGMRTMDLESNQNISAAVPHRILTQKNFSQNMQFRVLSDTTDDVRGNIKTIKARQIPELELGQEEINVGVIDTGVDTSHPYINNVVWEKDFRSGYSNPHDRNGHGTFVAGIITAKYNPSNNMRGVSPSVNIYNLKALDENGASSGISVGRAISEGVKGPDNEYGTEDDADIISMSIGRTTPGPATESAIENASKYATIIAASGNTNGGVVTYPAAYEKVLAVSSVDNELDPSDFSSRGSEIDIAAPGEDVLSTYKGGYSVESGTSISAPHVAAAAALTYAEKGGSNSEVQERLKKSARDIYRDGVDRATGHGILDMTRLIDADIPVEVIDMGPKRKTLKQKEVEFNFEVNEGADNPDKEYDIVGPGESINYKSISTKSFEEDLSKYNEDDNIFVRVKVTDDNGYTDVRKREYNIYKDKTPPVDIKEFNSVGRLFLGTKGSGDIVVENTEPVINHFEAKVVTKDSGSVVDSISKTFKPGEIGRFDFKFKPNEVGSQKYKLISPTHNISKNIETSVSVNSPLKIDMSVDKDNIMKGEKVNITINFEQKRSGTISNLNGAFYFKGEKKQDISVGVGAFGETIKKEYELEKEGKYTATLELKRHLSKNITNRVTVDCISRRNVSRGQSQYECSHELSRDIIIDNRTR